MFSPQYQQFTLAVDTFLWLFCSIDEDCLNDGFNYTPKMLFTWLTRVLYQRRSKFNPLWNTYIVGGFQDGEPYVALEYNCSRHWHASEKWKHVKLVHHSSSCSYLGYVDKIGTAYEAPTLASGFGAYLAQVRFCSCTADCMFSNQKARSFVDWSLVAIYRVDYHYSFHSGVVYLFWLPKGIMWCWCEAFKVDFQLM